VAYRLAIPPTIRQAIGSLNLSRENLLRLYRRLNEKLTDAAAIPETWNRPHAAYRNSFFYNVIFRGVQGQRFRFYCVCQWTSQDVITLRAIAPIRLR
jgi:hypothetical protein